MTKAMMNNYDNYEHGIRCSITHNNRNESKQMKRCDRELKEVNERAMDVVSAEEKRHVVLVLFVVF